MADPLPLKDPIACGFVDRVLQDWNGDLGFSSEVLDALRPASLDVIDLLTVIDNGVTISLEKEAPHETVFERFGTIDCGALLSVTLSFDPHLRGLTVVGFSKH